MVWGKYCGKMFSRSPTNVKAAANQFTFPIPAAARSVGGVRFYWLAAEGKNCAP